MTPSRLLALGLALLLAAGSPAAEIPKPPAYGNSKNNVAKMRSGLPEFRVKGNPQYLQDIKVVAQWLAYTVATPPYNGEPVPRGEDKGVFGERSMTTLMAEAESLCKLDPPPSSGGKLLVEQYEFAEEFGKALAQETKFVWANAGRPIERVNAIRLMSVAAKMPAPALADPLLEIIANDKVSEAERLYAFQGMRHLLEQPDMVDPTRHVIRDVAKLGQIADTLGKYVTEKRNPRDDRERALVEFVRRHAVAALAAMKDSVLRKPNKDVVARPAWPLMRVIGGDPAVTPPFTTVEKAEAMIGFCQMKVDPEMNLDVAAYMVAVAPVPAANTTLLGGLVEFARAVNEDNLRIDTAKADAKGDKPLPAAPWKLYAARLSYALSVWRENTRALPATRYPSLVSEVARQGITLLGLIEKQGTMASTGRDVLDLTAFATTNPPKAWGETPPKNAVLFRDDPASVVPFAAPAGATLKTDPKVDPKAPPKADPKADPKKGPAAPPAKKP